MKVQLKRDTDFIKIDGRLVIKIGNTEYRLRETNSGELEINKFNENETAISIRPIMSNEIVIV